jgi:hypothetical protein
VDEFVQVVPWYWSVEIEQSLAQVEHEPLLFLGLLSEPLMIVVVFEVTCGKDQWLSSHFYSSVIPIIVLSFQFCFSAVPLSVLEANWVLHVTSNQPAVTIEENQSLSLTGTSSSEQGCVSIFRAESSMTSAYHHPYM